MNCRHIDVEWGAHPPSFWKLCCAFFPGNSTLYNGKNLQHIFFIRNNPPPLWNFSKSSSIFPVVRQLIPDAFFTWNIYKILVGVKFCQILMDLEVFLFLQVLQVLLSRLHRLYLNLNPLEWRYSNLKAWPLASVKIGASITPQIHRLRATAWLLINDLALLHLVQIV